MRRYYGSSPSAVLSCCGFLVLAGCATSQTSHIQSQATWDVQDQGESSASLSNGAVADSAAARDDPSPRGTGSRPTLAARVEATPPSAQDRTSPSRQGACCIFGDCVDGESQESCEQQGGLWIPGITCAGFTCPDACCFSDGSCLHFLPGTCYQMGGQPQEPGSTCATVTCPLPPGACCIYGDCVDGESQESCEQQGGLWFPDNTCEGFTCPDACCFYDGSCDHFLHDECIQMGGQPQEPGSTCATVTCPLPPEACCFSTGICEDYPPDVCDSLGGDPQGPGTNCNQTTCPTGVIEIDQFDFSLGELELTLPDSTTELITVTGPATVHVFFEGSTEGTAGDDDGDTRDEVMTEMVDLQLSGISPTLGPVHVHLNPALPSFGEIEETQDVTTGLLDVPPFGPPDTTADSFFDLYFEIEVGGQLFHTVDPKRMSSVITHKPPGPGDVYENLTDIQLYDENGNPTEYFLSSTHHRPRPFCALGDTDDDGDVDLVNYQDFFGCSAGPSAEPPPSTECLRCFDYNGDNDVDVGDFGMFQKVFTGAP